MNYLQLVNNALREVGERTVADLSSPSALTTLAMEYLNFTVQDIYNRARWSFAAATVTYAPVADQALYDLPSTFDIVASDPRWTGGQLRNISPDELDVLFPDRSTSGTPLYYALWDDQIEFYPAPSSDWISGDVVQGTDSNYYVCIKDHTATTDDKPITGANYATYWLQDSAVSSGSTWTSGQAYEDKRIIMRFYRRPTDMSVAADDPDIPEKFMEILKIGTRYKMKKHLEMPDHAADFQEYEFKLLKQIRRRSQVIGPKRIRAYR